MSRPTTPQAGYPICKRILTHLWSKYCSPKCRLEFDYQQYTVHWLAGEVPGGRTEGRVSSHVRRWLFERANNKCEQCGWSRIHPVTGRVPLTVHHKDGNSENHRPENLELLCGGCHALTPNFGNLNHGQGRTHRQRRKLVESSSGM